MRTNGHVQVGSRQTAARRLSGHLKYLEQGASGGGYGLFSASADGVARRAALDDVLAHTSNRAQYHRLVLSPDPAARGGDLCAWTRAVLADLEQSQGTRLHWYAVVHHQDGKPHVHVVLAGAGESGVTGRREPVRLGAEEYAQLAASGGIHSQASLLPLDRLPDQAEAACEVHQ